MEEEKKRRCKLQPLTKTQLTLMSSLQSLSGRYPHKPITKLLVKSHCRESTYVPTEVKLLSARTRVLWRGAFEHKSRVILFPQFLQSQQNFWHMNCLQTLHCVASSLFRARCRWCEVKGPSQQRKRNEDERTTRFKRMAYGEQGQCATAHPNKGSNRNNVLN